MFNSIADDTSRQEKNVVLKHRVFQRGLAFFSILLKNPMNASTRLSMNGKSPMISEAPPFVLRLSKDERRVFQQNPFLDDCLRLRAYRNRALLAVVAHD
jgi:hypothetical protein